MPASATAFVFTPPSFSYASCWDKVAEGLRAKDYEVRTVDLETVTDGKGSPKSMYDDAHLIHDTIAKLADEGKNVVLVMNSYSGIPGTESSKGLSLKERQAEKKSGGLAKLVYVSSFLAPVGGSIMSLMGDKMPPMTTVPGPFLDFDVSTAKYIFSDLDEAEATKLAEGLGKHASGSFVDKLTYAGYFDIPTTYVQTMRDNAIPTDFQMKMIEDARSEGAKINHVTFDGDHTPQISQPDGVTKVLLEIVSDL